MVEHGTAEHRMQQYQIQNHKTQNAESRISNWEWESQEHQVWIVKS